MFGNFIIKIIKEKRFIPIVFLSSYLLIFSSSALYAGVGGGVDEDGANFIFLGFPDTIDNGAFMIGLNNFQSHVIFLC